MIIFISHILTSYGKVEKVQKESLVIHYSPQQDRLESFKRKGWPSHRKPTPEQLAKAGFYYLGTY